MGLGRKRGATGATYNNSTRARYDNVPNAYSSMIKYELEIDEDSANDNPENFSLQDFTVATHNFDQLTAIL